MSAMMISSMRQHHGVGIRHLQVLLLFLVVFIEVGLRICVTRGIPFLFLYNYSNTMDFNSFVTYTLVFYWTYTLLQLPIGVIASSKEGTTLKTLLSFIIFFILLMIGLINHMQKVELLYVISANAAIAQALVPICVHGLLGIWIPPSERARLGAIIYGGESLGKMAVILSIQATERLKGYSLIVFGILMFLTCIWCIIYNYLGSSLPSKQRYISQNEREYIEESLKIERNEISDQTSNLFNIFTSSSMWAIIIAHCCQVWLQFILAVIISHRNLIGIAPNITWMPHLMMWIVTLSIGYLSDYAVKSGVSTAVVRKICNTVGFCGPAIALAWLVKNFDHENCIIILTVAMSLNAASVCGFQINHIDLSPKYAGFLMSISTLFASIVNLVILYHFSTLQWLNNMIYGTIGSLLVANMIFIIFGKATVQHWNN